MSKRHEMAVLPGDGAGVEVTAEAIRVLEAVERRFPRCRFARREYPAGAQCHLDHGTDLPEETWEACVRADVVFLGAMGLPSVRRADGTEIAPQLDLRRRLDLYAGLRPVYLFHGEHTPLRGLERGDIDLVLVRESTEGLFVSRDAGVHVGDDVTVDNLVITRDATRRVVEFACRQALSRDSGRHVTCVDKANVFRTYAFFRRIFDEVTAGHTELRTSHAYIDAMALHLVRQPGSFDVVVTENMFGDILSDLAAGLVGGMGMAPSGDIGADHAVFQPAHGSAPDIAGTGKANPIAAILSMAMLLEHLGAKAGEEEMGAAAAAIRGAVASLFRDIPHTTPDLGGTLTCADVGSEVAGRLSGE